MVPYSKEMNMSYVVAGTPKWVRDLGYERFRLHGDKEGPDNGQGWQILRQVSPTQSHSNLGAAEKAISTVRGTIDESGVMSKDEIFVLDDCQVCASKTVDHQTRCVGSH